MASEFPTDLRLHPQLAEGVPRRDRRLGLFLHRRPSARARGGVGFLAPSERLNVAGIGAGGMGGGDIATVSRLGANIVVLCDVDDAVAWRGG